MRNAMRWIGLACVFAIGVAASGCSGDDDNEGGGGSGGVVPGTTGGTHSGGTMASGGAHSGGTATGGAETGGTPGTGGSQLHEITIQNLTFSPANLDVPPGATVTVRNLDGIQHSATSEAAAGDFTPGAVSGISFDTGLFTSGTRTFDIPATAAAGTVIHYYCRFHLGAMTPPNPTITIQ